MSQAMTMGGYPDGMRGGIGISPYAAPKVYQRKNSFAGLKASQDAESLNRIASILRDAASKISKEVALLNYANTEANVDGAHCAGMSCLDVALSLEAMAEEVETDDVRHAEIAAGEDA
ncbi:hypothetical protein [Acetobacter pasteurianus]|uniref:hypothetical protein n=1 Tax=Acetobacter pasteurianus TaxID=438 RepID=UPI003D144DDB